MESFGYCQPETSLYGEAHQRLISLEVATIRMSGDCRLLLNWLVDQGFEPLVFEMTDV